MQGIHAGFLIFTFASPLLLWILSRHLESERFARGICWFFAITLVVAYAGMIIERVRSGDFAGRIILPMQLCDWTLITAVITLTLRRQTCFELTYFWGLAGTLQALITPAVDTTSLFRMVSFFVIHSVIPASVFWLMFEFRMRPVRGALFRIFIWSEIYIAAALIANEATGENYGFLAQRPDTRSLLDFFSDTRWLYVLQINLTALIFFFFLDLPWQTLRRRQARFAGSAARLS